MKMMVAFDGSDAAWNALQLAVRYARNFSAEVWVVTSSRAEKNTSHLFQTEIGAAREALARIDQAQNTDGCRLRTHLSMRGMDPGEDIVRLASENEISAIFIGVRKRSKVGKLLLGSVAQYIILYAQCPVMAVK